MVTPSKYGPSSKAMNTTDTKILKNVAQMVEIQSQGQEELNSQGGGTTDFEVTSLTACDYQGVDQNLFGDEQMK